MFGGITAGWNKLPFMDSVRSNVRRATFGGKILTNSFKMMQIDTERH